MSSHNSKRSPHHLKARQGRPGGPPRPGPPEPSPSPSDPPTISTEPTEASSTSSSTSAPPASPTTATRTRTPPAPAPTTQQTSIAPVAPTTSATPTVESTTSTSSTVLPTSTTSSVPLTTATPTLVISTAPAVTQFHTNSDTLSTSTYYEPATVTPDGARSSSGADSSARTGAIAGGVIGAIGAIVLICALVAFFLRRWRRNRTTDEDFNPDDFVTPSPNFASHPDFPRSSTFDPNPPSMAQLTAGRPSSIASGPGMAGHGTYGYNTRGATATTAAVAGAGAGAGAAGAGVQERPAYVYGQSYDMDEANGPYSVEPQMQTAYNAEAYGGYAYTTEGNQAAYYNQQGGGAAAAVAGGYATHPYQTQQFQAHYQDNAPVAAAVPRVTPGAGSVPAGRSTPSARSRSIYDEDDAYGGI